MTTLRKSNNICLSRKVVILRNVSFNSHPAAFLRIWHSIKSNHLEWIKENVLNFTTKINYERTISYSETFPIQQAKYIK